MSKPAPQELVEAINTFVESQTFSLDALKGIEELRVRATKLESDLKLYQRMYSEAAETLRQTEAKLVGMGAREQALTEREVKCRDAELKTAVAEAKQSAYADIFSRMFANRQVREQIISDTYVAIGNPAYPTKMQDGKTVTREEG